MTRFPKLAAAAAALIFGLAAAPALLAAGSNAPARERSMSGHDMMGNGMMGSGTMGQMMDHCSQMMQGMSGGSDAPNDQWRKQEPAAPEKKR